MTDTSARTQISTKSETARAAAFPLAGIARAAGAMLLWSSSGLLIDRLGSSYGLTVFQISAWRVLLVLPILAAVAAALSFSAPAFIALGDRFLFGMHLRRVQIGAIAVNLLGCGLAAGLLHPAELFHSPAGFLVGITNGLAFTVYTLINRGGVWSRDVDPLATLFYIFLAGGIGLLAWGLAAEGTGLVQLHLKSSGWILLLALALGPTLGAYALYNASLRRLAASVAGMITTLEPAVVAVAALVILGRMIDVVQWIGIALIVAAVLTMQLSARRATSS